MIVAQEPLKATIKITPKYSITIANAKITMLQSGPFIWKHSF
jgi:hypothetical protein